MNSKKRMIYSIKNLLDRYPIEKITVDMIVKESDLSKTTFYRYFQDKYILMKEYYFYMVDNILSKDGTTFEEIYMNLLLFIKKNKEYFVELTKQNGRENFFDIFYESSYCHSIRIMEENKKSHLTQEEIREISFFISGCTFMTEQWIANHFAESPQKLISIIRKCVPKDIESYL